MNQSCSIFLPWDGQSINNLSIFFTKPDGSRYVVVSTFSQPLMYLATLGKQTYIVYNAAKYELDQRGTWSASFTLSLPHEVPQFKFQIYADY